MVTSQHHRVVEAAGSAPDSSYDYFSQPVLIGIGDGRFMFQVPAERVPPRTITVVLGWESLMDR